MKTGIATIATFAISLASVSASCPFPADLNNSPCAVDSICISDGLLHADCQSHIQEFCCAGNSFVAYPEVASLCSGLSSCGKQEARRVSRRSLEEGESGPAGDCVDGEVFTLDGSVTDNILGMDDFDFDCSLTDGENTYTLTVEDFFFDDEWDFSVVDEADNVVASDSVQCDDIVSSVVFSYDPEEETVTATCVEGATPTIYLTGNWMSEFGDDDWTYDLAKYELTESDDAPGTYTIQLPAFSEIARYIFKFSFGQGEDLVVGCGDDQDEDCYFTSAPNMGIAISFTPLADETPVTYAPVNEDGTTGIPFVGGASGIYAGAATVLLGLFAAILMA